MTAPRLEIARPGLRHEQAFLAAAARSRRLHAGLVSPPRSSGEYRRWIARLHGERHDGNLVLAPGEDDALVGVVNLNEIVRGSFHSAFLGYYAFEPWAGRGCMTRGLRLVLRRAFGELRLHRVEANIQPGNEASRRLVQRLGFRCEGFSPRYLKVSGRWRDHERWALLADELRGR